MSLKPDSSSHLLTSKKSLMSSTDVIPGEFNFLTPFDSYLFIVLVHFFLLTLHMHINNESLRSNLVKVHQDSETSTGIQEQHNITWK